MRKECWDANTCTPHEISPRQRTLVQTSEASMKQDAYDSITAAYLAIFSFDRLQVAFNNSAGLR